MCRTPIGGGTSAALGLPHPAGLAFCITLLHAGTVRRRRGPGGVFFCRSSELGDVGAATSAEAAGDPFPMVASEAHCAPELELLQRRLVHGGQFSRSTFELPAGNRDGQLVRYPAVQRGASAEAIPVGYVDTHDKVEIGWNLRCLTQYNRVIGIRTAET
ncbi:hypothetical protein PVAP13_1KG254920 [Panicum virgatum]|uniref:Uncharacterized protein n=1 Tax=Panicum virgatum TaxID=38727 RepID=A0A8T0XMV6_PANVG|nr:hypothetical protein PVAP13_1KG254920 [Panicum virgatum]